MLPKKRQWTILILEVRGEFKVTLHKSENEIVIAIATKVFGEFWSNLALMIYNTTISSKLFDYHTGLPGVSLTSK